MLENEVTTAAEQSFGRSMSGLRVLANPAGFAARMPH
jgi:hypothetical protein